MAALRRADLDLFVRAVLMTVFPSGADEDNFRSFVRIFSDRRDDHFAAFHNGEHCAQQIRGARFIPLEGDIHFPWLGDWQSVLTPVLEFLLGDDSGGPANVAE